MISAVTTPAAATTSRRFTSWPMSVRLLVKNSSGTSANGRPKERKTWLRTSALDGSKPTAITISAGIINLAMLATAAAVFHSRGLFGAGSDLERVFAGLNRYLGGHSGMIFGIALLASGIASSCVGTMSGQVVMQGFLHRQIPVFARRSRSP